MSDSFEQNIESLFRGMDNFMTTKTVVGEAVHVGDTIILPLVDVTFGVAASAKNEPQKKNGGGGMGGRMTPSALLVIKDGSTRLINIRSQDSITRVIDLVPDLVNRFMPGKKGEDPEVKQACEDAAKKEEKI